MTWIDYAQAIGTILAFPTAAWGIVMLFKKDKEKQSQIDSLADLAEESKNQTEVFQGQLEKMEEGNRIQSEYLSKLSQLLASGQESAEIQKEQAITERRIRKNDIKPKIISRGGNATGNKGSQKFLNAGKESAKIISIEYGDKNDIKILNKDSLIDLELDPGKLHSFNWRGNRQEAGSWRNLFDLKVVVEDVDGNQYEYEIQGEGNHAKYSKLVERDT